MSLRTRFQTAIRVSALLLLHSAVIAQEEPVTADHVISKYMDAIGATRFSTITTLVQSGEISGNLTNFWQGYRSPGQSQDKQRGTFESYFKVPNLRFNSTVTEKNQVIALHGCNGKVAWYIDPFLKRTEFTPKTGSEGECEEGFKVPLSRLRDPNLKMRLLKKKEMEGRMAWEIKVDGKSPGSGTYYFDADTFLLLRFERFGTSVTYADYRDVGGIKLPFTTVQEFTNSKLVTTLREVKINTPIDDARFAEPKIMDGKIAWNTNVPRQDDAEVANAVPATPPPMNSEPKLPATNTADSVVEVSFPNYTSCPLAELESTVPELKGLKASADQARLPDLLEKVGTKTSDTARNMPNLISRERVIESSPGAGETRRDYDYLILAHAEGNVINLDEFRLDLKSGDKFQTDEMIKNNSTFWENLKRASNETATSKGIWPPIFVGFATSWVHFYPSSRMRTTYRYLGEQKRDGHHTLVLAFAQKPASVLLPAIFRYQDKTAPMFLQGIAWIDPSDFRILRLRTDLLLPVPELSLHRLTAEIQFAPTQIEQVSSPLQLPFKVSVTATVGESTNQEVHEYSEYRLFRAVSRVVPLP